MFNKDAVWQFGKFSIDTFAESADNSAMKTIQKVVFVISILLLAANSYAGRWLTKDPIGFMERDPKPTTPIATVAPRVPEANLYTFVDNNPINEVDPLGLWGVAFGNNSGSHYVNVGWGNPNYYYSPSVYAPSQINGPVSGLAIYTLGEGDPVTIGPDLQAALQDLQKNKPWPRTDNDCANQSHDLGWKDYRTWQHPYDSLDVYSSLGNFRYNNDGTMTSVNDTYAFPLVNSDWHGGTDNRNAIYHSLPGTPYNDSGSWGTPNH